MEIQGFRDSAGEWKWVCCEGSPLVPKHWRRRWSWWERGTMLHLLHKPTPQLSTLWLPARTVWNRYPHSNYWLSNHALSYLISFRLGWITTDESGKNTRLKNTTVPQGHFSPTHVSASLVISNRPLPLRATGQHRVILPISCLSPSRILNPSYLNRKGPTDNDQKVSDEDRTEVTSRLS